MQPVLSSRNSTLRFIKARKIADSLEKEGATAELRSLRKRIALCENLQTLVEAANTQKLHTLDIFKNEELMVAVKDAVTSFPLDLKLAITSAQNHLRLEEISSKDSVPDAEAAVT